jgi:PAS domain S-box
MKETVASVFDDLEIGITLHDPETGAIRGVNSRLEELYGYSEAELRELSVADYSATDEGYTQAAAEARIQAAAAGEPQALEWVIERADGERVPVRVRLAHTELDGEAYVIAEIRDISDRKQQAADLEAERGFIEQSLETLDDAFYCSIPTAASGDGTRRLPSERATRRRNSTGCPHWSSFRNATTTRSASR